MTLDLQHVILNPIQYTESACDFPLSTSYSTGVKYGLIRSSFRSSVFEWHVTEEDQINPSRMSEKSKWNDDTDLC